MLESNVQLDLSSNILKSLLDKTQEKRQTACKQLEIVVLKFADKKKYNQIEHFIIFFKEKYIKSNDTTKKRAGLDVLTSVVNVIRDYPQAANRFTQTIVNIILQCLNDPEHKIRFVALKALYYVSKALQEKILCMFNPLFEHIISKITDLDEDVKNAAKFLNQGLLTILNQALSNPDRRQQFDLKTFMGILTSKFKSMNPAIRGFLIEWIETLNDIASIDLVPYIPQILEDLLFMLGDKQQSLRIAAGTCLKKFEKDLTEKFQTRPNMQSIMSQQVMNSILNILIKTAKAKSTSVTKMIVLGWFNMFFMFFRSELENKNKLKNKKTLKKIIIERFDEVLQPILLLMSYEEEEVRKKSLATNDILMQNIQMINKQETINFAKVMPLLKDMLSQKKSSSTSETVLRWMKFMLENYNDKVLPQINDIIEKLVEKLCDSNTKSVISIIEATAVTGQYFQLLIERMLFLLFSNKSSTQQKPEQILKKFCSVLQPEKFCRTVCSQVVSTFQDKNFVFQIVQALNFIVIADKSMSKVRNKLHKVNQGLHQQLFLDLFKAFKYNPAASASLCLLSQQYELAYKILQTFGKERQINNTILIGFCKLANLVQSPGFLFLRLQLLEPDKHPFLINALCALLMILPQGKIFNMLRNRIQVSKYIPSQGVKESLLQQQIKEKKILLIENCLKDFNKTQDLFSK